MSVTLPDHLEPGATSLDVNVSVNGATVTVVKSGKMLGKAKATDGYAQVSLSPAPVDGELVVTAVDPDYVPYEGELPVGGAPTAVRLAGYAVQPGQAGVRLTWETGQELNNLGFNIYRSRQEAVETAGKLNAELIPSQAFGSVVGATYEYVDTRATAGAVYHYWLQDVELSGALKMHYLGSGKWSKPWAVSVYPNAGGRLYTQGQRFMATFRDNDADLATVYLLINNRPDPAGGMLVRYQVQEGLLSTYDERVKKWTAGLQPGVAASAGAKMGILRAANSVVEVAQEGQLLRVGWMMRFWVPFIGQHNIYILAEDAAGNSSGWQLAGAWQVRAE